jgi:hypothetical protein
MNSIGTSLMTLQADKHCLSGWTGTQDWELHRVRHDHADNGQILG